MWGLVQTWSLTAALSVMNGNVGLGTWVPNAILSIQNSSATQGNASIMMGTGSNKNQFP